MDKYWSALRETPVKSPVNAASGGDNLTGDVTGAVDGDVTGGDIVTPSPPLTRLSHTVLVDAQQKVRV